MPEIQSAFFSWDSGSHNFQLYLLVTCADIHSHFRNLKGIGLLKQQNVKEGYWAKAGLGEKEIEMLKSL